MPYCRRVAAADPLQRAYHEAEYGFPVADDRILFERLSLEIFQAGLSWRLVLMKRPAFVRAFAGFDVARVAAFDEADVGRLLADAEIIRNRGKIEAVIANARVLVGLSEGPRRDGGNGEAADGGRGRFADWLDDHHPRNESEWLTSVSSDLSLHGQGGRARVSCQYRLSGGRARRRLSGAGPHSCGRTAMVHPRSRRLKTVESA